jgi:hypothetical protein
LNYKAFANDSLTMMYQGYASFHRCFDGTTAEPDTPLFGARKASVVRGSSRARTRQKHSTSETSPYPMACWYQARLLVEIQMAAQGL